MSKYQGAYRANTEEEINDPTFQPVENQQDDGQEADGPEEDSFKKRYGDLRRHMQSTLSTKEDEIRKLKDQLDQAARKQIKFPKSETEIADWVEKYPDVAAIIDTIAQKRALEALEIGEGKMKNLEKLEAKLNREKAEQELLKYHPDFNEIRSDKAFHEWVQEQPKWVQDALYENDTDARAAARAIDLYKSDTKRKPGRPPKDAAQGFRTPNGPAPTPEKKGRFSESQVSKMSGREYEQNEPAIMEAMRTGAFVYDLSGAAR